jgi:hypothetical protein
MNDQLTKAKRIIQRLRERQAVLHAAILGQARVIAELDQAAEDVFRLTNKPLNFVRGLVAELREELGPDVGLVAYEKPGGMVLVVPPMTFAVTAEDYELSFPQFLSAIKQHIQPGSRPCPSDH